MYNEDYNVITYQVSLQASDRTRRGKWPLPAKTRSKALQDTPTCCHFTITRLSLTWSLYGHNFSDETWSDRSQKLKFLEPF